MEETRHIDVFFRGNDAVDEWYCAHRDEIMDLSFTNFHHIDLQGRVLTVSNFHTAGFTSATPKD